MIQEKAVHTPALAPDGRGKYDVSVEAGPSFTTRREEAAGQMMAFVQAFPQAAPMIGDLVAKNLDWPGADDIARRLSALLPPQVTANPAPGGAGDGAHALIQAGAAKIQDLTGQLAAAQQALVAVKADRAVEARKVEVEAFRAQTERMQTAGALGTSAEA